MVSFWGQATSNPQLRPFPFMKLPPELRNRIYRFACARPIVYINQSHITRKAANSDAMKQPSLLQICGDIRSEARSMYFHYRHFKMILRTWPEMKGVLWWLDRIGRSGKENVRYLSLEFQKTMPLLAYFKLLNFRLSDKARLIFRGKSYDLFLLAILLVREHQGRALQFKTRNLKLKQNEREQHYLQRGFPLNEEASLPFLPRNSWCGLR